MKRFLAILLTMVFLFSLAACKKIANSVDPNPYETFQSTSTSATSKHTTEGQIKTSQDIVSSQSSTRMQNQVKKTTTERATITKKASTTTTKKPTTTKITTTRPTTTKLVTTKPTTTKPITTQTTATTTPNYYASSEAIELFLDFLNSGISNQTKAMQCLTNYIKTSDQSYVTYFYEFVELAYNAVGQAYGMSLEYEDMHSMSSDLKASLDILYSILNGSYSPLELGDMIEESLNHLENVVNICKQLAHM